LILSSGQLAISSGGTAVATVISNGGSATVSSGGTANGTVVSSGGAEYVSSGGTLTGATLSGGFLEIRSGGTAGASEIDFTSAGGTLQLDDSQHFSGVISGFGVPGGIDLRDIAFNSTTTTLGYSGNTSSGVLTVSDGLRTATIHLLGQYTAGNFALQSDGNIGTLITDPPLANPSSMTNPHG
jgi:autotransporter passenger strand-loop-strand repeat protein